MSPALLAAADVLLHVLHLLVIVLNVFGWVWQRTRRLHRWVLGITAFCWLVVGPLYGGIGYCPLTDWHWRVKAARGEVPLPASYIDYLLQMVGIHASPFYIDVAVGAVFAVTCIMTLILWWRAKKKKIKSTTV